MSATAPPMAREVPQMAAPAGILRLEHFVEQVLKQALRTALLQRDEVRGDISQCVQLRALFREMDGLSRDRSFITHDPRQQQQQQQQPRGNNSGGGSGASPPPSSSSSSSGNRVLVDLGNHFYTPARIRDASRVHMNLGCGVVLAMSVVEASAFLDKKEKLLRSIAMNHTKEVLRLTYRIRLVTEAIARLNANSAGLH